MVFGKWGVLATESRVARAGETEETKSIVQNRRVQEIGFDFEANRIIGGNAVVLAGESVSGFGFRRALNRFPPFSCLVPKSVE